MVSKQKSLTYADVQTELESILRVFFDQFPEDDVIPREAIEILQDEIDSSLGALATRGKRRIT